MKKIALACSMFFFAASAFSQTAAKSIYFELGGPGLASFNYDTRFTKKEDGIGARVGLGGLKVDGEGLLFVPVGLNYLLGKDKKNFFEIGTGITFMSASEDIFDSDASSTSFGYMQFGYRYQPKNGGFLFRASITPLFGKGFFFPYYAGVSFGYKF
jgi:hypothetical protein